MSRAALTHSAVHRGKTNELNESLSQRNTARTIAARAATEGGREAPNVGRGPLRIGYARRRLSTRRGTARPRDATAVSAVGRRSGSPSAIKRERERRGVGCALRRGGVVRLEAHRAARSVKAPCGPECSAEGEHALDGDQGAAPEVFGHFEARLEVAQGQVDFFRRVEAHERALVAGAVTLGRRGDELLLRRALLHLVNDARLGDDDEGLSVVVLDVFEESGGGADEVGAFEQRLFALGVGDDFCAGVLLLDGEQLTEAEGLVNDAAPLPEP